MCAAMNKPLNLEERSYISSSLIKGLSFKQIARDLERDCSTISKEIRLNSFYDVNNSFNKKYNPCMFRKTCQTASICKNCASNGRLCKSCSSVSCFNICNDFKEEICDKLKKPPYVCNGCSDSRKCSLRKRKYDPIKAQESYQSRLSESRKGIIIDEKELENLNTLLYPLIVEQNQSIHHVYVNHADEIMISEKTLYKLIDAGLLKVRNIDLPLKVRRKPRKKEARVKVDKKCRKGRTFKDFNEYLEKNGNNISTVQIDTVEGSKGGKVLLTIHFPNCHLMLAYLRDANDSKSVIDVFNHIYDTLGHDEFTKLFPVILTDNGSEFSNPSAIEFSLDGRQRTKVFYCDPSASYQKAECENNHRLIRYISPKGKSMDDYSQEDVFTMMSHIDSYARKAINDLTPIDLFNTIYGDGILEKLSIMKIHHDSINLSPSLISRKEENKNEER